MIPSCMKEVWSRFDCSENARKIEHFPSDPSPRAASHVHLNRAGDGARGERTVAHAHESDPAARKLLEDLGNDEADTGGRSACEGPQVDGDSGGAGHGGTLREGRPHVNESPHLTS